MSFSKMWTQNFLKCMGFMQRKATTSKSKYTVENFSDVFLNVMAVVVMDNVRIHSCALHRANVTDAWGESVCSYYYG